jgi:Predicted membrane protein
MTILCDRKQLFELTPKALSQLEKVSVYEDLFIENLARAMNQPQTSDVSQRGIRRHNEQMAEQLSVTFAHPALYSQGADMLCALTHIALADQSPFKESEMTERERELLNQVRIAVGEFKMERPQVATMALHLGKILNDARETGERRDREFGTHFFLTEGGDFRFEDIKMPKELRKLAAQDMPAESATWVAEKINGRLTATLAAKPKIGDIFTGALKLGNECSTPEEKMGAFLGFMVANMARLAIGRPYKESISHRQATALMAQDALARTLPQVNSIKSREDEGIAGPPADPASVAASSGVEIPTPPPVIPEAPPPPGEKPVVEEPAGSTREPEVGSEPYAPPVEHREEHVAHPEPDDPLISELAGEGGGTGFPHEEPSPEEVRAATPSELHDESHTSTRFAAERTAASSLRGTRPIGSGELNLEMAEKIADGKPRTKAAGERPTKAVYAEHEQPQEEKA